MTNKKDEKKPANSDAFDADVRFSRARTIDHEVRRLPDSSLERRRKRRELTVNEELAARQARAGEHGVRWARLAAVVALAARELGAWPYIKAGWE